MIKSTIFVLSMLIVVSCASITLAGVNSGALVNSISEEEQEVSGQDEDKGKTPRFREADPWWPFLYIRAGIKHFSDDWKEDGWANVQFCFNFPSRDPGRIESEMPGYFWAFDYSLSVRRVPVDEDKRDFYYRIGDAKIKEEYDLHEIHFGIRQVKNMGRWYLYWGGGLALAYVDVDTPDSNARFRGHDDGSGYWIGVGVEKINEYRSDDSSLGFYIRYSDVDLNNWEVNSGGLYYGISIGHR